MSALEWLDAVRADLEAATPGPWRWRNTEEPLLTGAHSRTVMAFSRMGTQRAQPEFRDADGLLTTAGKANLNSYPDANLIASTPDRLDRMERALRAVMEMPVPDGRHRADLRFVYAAALDDVRATIREELSDE